MKRRASRKTVTSKTDVNQSGTAAEDDKRLLERNNRTLNFAHQLAELGERRESAESTLVERQQARRDAQAAEKDAERQVDRLQQEINHLVGCIIGNERGQLTFDFAASEKAGQTQQPTGPAGSDVGGTLPLSELLKYGLTHKKFDQLQESPYGDELQTVGDLERLITKTNGYFWKKVKGWGEKFATGDGENDFPNIHLRFREANPVASEAQQGRRRCSECSHVFEGVTKCPECGSSFFIAVDDEQPPAAPSHPPARDDSEDPGEH